MRIRTERAELRDHDFRRPLLTLSAESSGVLRSAIAERIAEKTRDPDMGVEDLRRELFQYGSNGAGPQ